jgi:chromosome segregation ATPase
MNPLIITVISPIATLIASIFAANFLNQRFIERLIDQQNKSIDVRLEQQTKLLDAKLDALRAEFKSDFNILRGEIAALRSEIAALNARITSLEQRVERIECQLDKIFKPALPGI